MASLEYSPTLGESPSHDDGQSHGIEGATQSWDAGALLKLSSGELVIAKSSAGDLGSGDDPIGVANAPATGVEGSDVSFSPILPGKRYKMQVYHATPGSALTAQSQVGTAYGLTLLSTGQFVVNLADTSNTKVRVVDIPKDYPVGEQYGYVEVVFLTAELQGGGA